MKRLLLIAFLGCMSFCMMCAQLPVGQLFLSMPDSLCPMLDMRQRVVLLEYVNQQLQDSVVNIYGGQSRVLAKTDNYICLEAAEGVTMEILADTSSFILIQTACAPVCSSIVKRYIANWLFMEELRPDHETDFMKAVVVDGRIVWSDETPLLLDDEEKKHYQTP